MSRRRRERPSDAACGRDVAAPRSPRARRFVALTLLAVVVSAGVAAGSDEGELLSRIKSAAFDRDWTLVLADTDRFIASFPHSPSLPRAYYYRAQALESLERNDEAIKAHGEFLSRFPGGEDALLRRSARCRILFGRLELCADLQFEVFNKLQKKVVVRANLPLAFADILLEALDEYYRGLIYDRMAQEQAGPPPKLLDFRKLVEAIRSGECPQTILEIDTDEESIHLWIE